MENTKREEIYWIGTDGIRRPYRLAMLYNRIHQTRWMFNVLVKPERDKIQIMAVKLVRKICEAKQKKVNRTNSFNDYFFDYSKVTPEGQREVNRLVNEARKVSPHPEYLKNPVDIPPFLKMAEVAVNPKCYGYILGEMIASEGFKKLREQVKKERTLSLTTPLH